MLRFLTGVLLSLIVLAANGCEGLLWNEPTWASQARASGEIRVLTLDSPLVDSSAATQNRGFEHDLLKEFAGTYGLRLRFIRKQRRADLIAGLRSGEGDIAAGRIWNPSRVSDLLSGPIFDESPLELFCHHAVSFGTLRDLNGRRVGLARKDDVLSLSERLRVLVPGIELFVDESAEPASMVRKLAHGTLDCVIAEKLEGQLESQGFPAIEDRGPMTGEFSLTWLIRENRKDLQGLLNAWFQRASRDDEIMRVRDRYVTTLNEVDPADISGFLTSLRERLPEYRRTFEQAAREENVDWRLLGAVAYQESRWEPEARSFTGVRGLMQLTLETASFVGVTDRDDPQQSINGGAHYLRTLYLQTPKMLEPADRWSLALAAYNCGLAHLHDAQTLAIQRGLDPYSWRSLRQTLPLLEDPMIAMALPYGSSRGRETVQFVDRVLTFQRLWERFGPAEAAAPLSTQLSRI